MTVTGGSLRSRSDLSWISHFVALCRRVAGTRRSVRLRRERAEASNARGRTNGYQVAGHARLFHVTRRTTLRAV